MKLPQAILRVLVDSPRAITAQVIAGYVGGFTGQTHTLHDVELALDSLQREGLVKGTSARFLGVVWKETDDGRLALA